MIAETEFWPNIFAECGRRRIPLLLVNGRVSQASLRGYLRVPKIDARDARATPTCCARRRASTRSGCAISARPSRSIHVTGNLKFDVELPAQLLDEARALREHWGARRGPYGSPPARIAGEERKVLDAFAQLKRRFSARCCSCSCRGIPSGSAPWLACAASAASPWRCAAGRRASCRQARKCSSATRWASCSGSTRPPTSRSSAAASCRTAARTCSRRAPCTCPSCSARTCSTSKRSARWRSSAAPRGKSTMCKDSSRPSRLYFEQPDLRRAAGQAPRHTLVTDNRGALVRTLALVRTRASRAGPIMGSAPAVSTDAFEQPARILAIGASTTPVAGSGKRRRAPV